MLVLYIFKDPAVWIAPLVIQIISYVFILRKMGKRPLMGIIPVLGEYEMSQDLFRKGRSFWRPAIIAAALGFTALYIGGGLYTFILKLVAIIVYGIFLARLYIRLSIQFGKGIIFAAGMIILPFIFLPLLAFGRSWYFGPKEFGPEIPLSPFQSKLRKTIFVLISAAELAALIGGCFFVTILGRPTKPVVRLIMDELTKDFDKIAATEEYVSRADTVGADFEAAADEQRSREYYFGDHSGDSKVVVMEYIIGSNLEDSRGCASINIAQMKDSTEKGDGLDFVIQAGGSKRWFTKGIEDASVGRYLISGGDLTEEEMLPSDTCMSEGDSLKDFIVWTKENHPADRYMLVLWDHGGGFSLGYGEEGLNKRQGSSNLMPASEIIKAVKDSGVKFDLIGFDACLMQNLEYANAFEPYADYYLASEESEPGTGWFYTSGFSKLAKDPTISTEDFGCAMVSSYDQLNRVSNDGEPQPADTLSLVDLTLVKPVYKRLAEFYSDAADRLPSNPGVFTNMSAARSNAYQFGDNEQIDMANYLETLKKADYKETVAAENDLDEFIEDVKLCVVCRNKDSAEGVNGISIEFPYSDLSAYNDEYEQLKAAKYRKEEKFFNSFCSILASQQKRQNEEVKNDGLLGALLSAIDYTKEEWYVKGFEDYDTADLFIDIPVSRIGDAYLAEFPDKIWDAILDCSTAAYMETEDGLMYLGQEHFDAKDEEGHPLVVASDSWAHIGGRLVCYNSDVALETDEGKLYMGSVHARLNRTQDVTLSIEWDLAKEDSDKPITGKVTGYSINDDESPAFMQKGQEELKSGDVLEFLFDFYDEEGNYIKTDVYGKSLRVVKKDGLTVKDEAFDEGDVIEYYGVFKDVYQRELMTEVISPADSE